MGKENKRNYYRILHVQPDAPVEIIQASYRTLMQRLKAHPDLGGDHWNAAVINEAYAVLLDPERRAAYDRQTFHIDNWRQQHGMAAADPAETPEQEFQPGPAPSPDDSRHSSNPLFCAFCKTPYETQKVIGADAMCTECHSPLAPARAPRLEASWRRSVIRVPQVQQIAYYDHWPQAKGFAGQTRDISLSGMRFETDREVANGGFVKIDAEHCQAVARVIYCRPCNPSTAHDWVVGVEFFTLRFERARGTFLSAHA